MKLFPLGYSPLMNRTTYLRLPIWEGSMWRRPPFRGWFGDSIYHFWKGLKQL